MKKVTANSQENMGAASDEDLAQRVADGDAAALEQLYNRYSRQAMSLAFRIVAQAELAEEIVQEIFLKFWQQPQLYQAERGRFLTWLLSIVHHRAVNERKRSAYRLNTSADAPITHSEDESLTLGSTIMDERQSDLHEEVVLRLEREHVRQALNCLNPDQRRAIELAYFEGLNQQEIAKKLGVPVGTVKTRIRLGLQKLKAQLEVERVDSTSTSFSVKPSPASPL